MYSRMYPRRSSLRAASVPLAVQTDEQNFWFLPGTKTVRQYGQRRNEGVVRLSTWPSATIGSFRRRLPSNCSWTVPVDSWNCRIVPSNCPKGRSATSLPSTRVVIRVRAQGWTRRSTSQANGTGVRIPHAAWTCGSAANLICPSSWSTQCSVPFRETSRKTVETPRTQTNQACCSSVSRARLSSSVRAARDSILARCAKRAHLGASYGSLGWYMARMLTKENSEDKAKIVNRLILTFYG